MSDLSHEPNPGRMPLWQHLEELRSVLVRSLLALVLGTCVTYYFSDAIVLFLETPLLGLLPTGSQHLYFTGITDKFVIYLKVSLLAAILVCAPYILFQIWTFIRPALYKNERKFATAFVSFGFFAFLLGLVFTYFIIVPYGYKFLLEFGNTNDRPLITLTEYFDLTLKLMLAIGLVFEIPVLLVLLGKMGIIDVADLVRYRRHAIIVIAIISAVATPSPDAFTMLLVMIPLVLLYEMSIVALKWTSKPIAA